MLNKLLDQLWAELRQTHETTKTDVETEPVLQNYFVAPWRPYRQQLLGKLIAHLENYHLMMNEEQTAVNRRLANEWVLKKNFVFNSPFANKQLRDAIRTRKLPCDEALFQKAYQEILEQKTEVVAIVRRDTYDLIPLSIPAGLLLEAGLKEAYLLKQCQEHGITLRKLEDLVFLRAEHKTGFPKLVELYDQGFSCLEIGLFLEVREAMDFAVTINKIIAFWNCFGKPDDAGYMADAITNIANTFEIYPSQALKRMIETANKYQQFEIEGVVYLFLSNEAENSLSSEAE